MRKLAVIGAITMSLICCQAIADKPDADVDSIVVASTNALVDCVAATDILLEPSTKQVLVSTPQVVSFENPVLVALPLDKYVYRRHNCSGGVSANNLSNPTLVTGYLQTFEVGWQRTYSL